ncbi:MAG: DUF45 domain-containing protein [Dysgonamonadaceae bacterium]|nr:DUF45 domain-containing protein [Dysgonamonadaceae bacterium]
MEKRCVISVLKCNFVAMNGFFDKDLGNVIVKKNSRAKKMIVRRKSNQIQITVPNSLSKREILKHFEKLKPQILALPATEVVKITEQSKIKTFTFDATISRKSINSDKLSLSLKDKALTIDVPSHYNITAKNVQSAIRRLFIHALRLEAKRVLPGKVIFFAKKWNLNVAEIKINSSKGRWGSCSNKKNINLSLFLMMLPEYLIDYVVLHELAHTIELNHSKKFWELLDIFCDGKAAKLNQESKNWKCDYLSYLKQ